MISTADCTAAPEHCLRSPAQLLSVCSPAQVSAHSRNHVGHGHTATDLFSGLAYPDDILKVSVQLDVLRFGRLL
jgi:hypothetical protein